MTEFATIDWFAGWGTSVFSENTVIFVCCFQFRVNCSLFWLEIYLLRYKDTRSKLHTVINLLSNHIIWMHSFTRTVTVPNARVHHWQELLTLVTKLHQRQ